MASDPPDSLSVVITAYQCARYLGQAIDSVLAQDDAQHAKGPLSGRRLATPPKVSKKYSLFSQRCDNV